MMTTLEKCGRRGTGAIVAIRILMAATVVLAMGVVGTALSEYRLLQAVAHLPGVSYERVVSTECAADAATGTTQASEATDTTTSYAGSAPYSGDAWGLSSLAGFRCTIPLTPD